MLEKELATCAFSSKKEQRTIIVTSKDARDKHPFQRLFQTYSPGNSHLRPLCQNVNFGIFNNTVLHAWSIENTTGVYRLVLLDYKTDYISP